MGEATTTNTTLAIYVRPPPPTGIGPDRPGGGAAARGRHGPERRVLPLPHHLPSPHRVPSRVRYVARSVYDGWVTLLHSIHPSRHQRGRRPTALLHPLAHRLGRLGERQAHQRHRRPPARRSVAQGKKCFARLYIYCLSPLPHALITSPVFKQGTTSTRACWPWAMSSRSSRRRAAAGASGAGKAPRTCHSGAVRVWVVL